LFLWRDEKKKDENEKTLAPRRWLIPLRMFTSYLRKLKEALKSCE